VRFVSETLGAAFSAILSFTSLRPLINRPEEVLTGVISANWAIVYLRFTKLENVFTHTLVANPYNSGCVLVPRWVGPNAGTARQTAAATAPPIEGGDARYPRLSAPGNLRSPPMMQASFPATGEIEDKHFWLVEHDGLVFGSGWHHDVQG